jgi:hypothetical protein
MSIQGSAAMKNGNDDEPRLRIVIVMALVTRQLRHKVSLDPLLVCGCVLLPSHQDDSFDV